MLLNSYLADWAATDPVRIAVSTSVLMIAKACTAIDGIISTGVLANSAGIGFSDQTRTQEFGLDTLANERIIEALSTAPVATLVSAGLKEPLELSAGAPLILAVEPLDGASNIDTNLSAGTIFSIFGTDTEDADTHPTLQRGERQLAAGYVIYGPHTALLLTCGKGTCMFMLDTQTGDFRLCSPEVKICETTREFAINVANFRRWDGHMRAYVDDCLNGMDGPHECNYNMRWTSSLVAECHRIMSRGGIFLSPADRRLGFDQGRLRLLYECNPIAFLAEQAGGEATNGYQRILNIKPETIHQQAPMIFGSRNEVKLVENYYSGIDPFNERSQLFGKRGLYKA